jgi:uncharacterized damage-inducible protein DinB
MSDGAAYFPAIRHLAEYEVWCNARSFEAAASLPPDDLRRLFPFGLGTIHKTLFHVVDVFRGWSGCVGVTIRKPQWMTYDASVPLADVAALSEQLSAEFLRAVDACHSAGLLHQDRRIDQVFHLVTHGTHHRTQFITMLRLLGKDPPFEAGNFGGWSKVPGISVPSAAATP